MLSPDGRWIATTLSDNGRNDVFVRAFAPTDNGASLWRVTSTGCGTPVWMPDGTQLYFRCGSKIAFATVTTRGNGLDVGTVKDVATLPPRERYSTAFSVASDGWVLLLHMTGRDHPAVICNWSEVLRRIEQGDLSR